MQLKEALDFGRARADRYRSECEREATERNAVMIAPRKVSRAYELQMLWTALALLDLPREFTIPELRRAYGVLLGQEPDPRNFNRDMQSSGLVEATGKFRQGSGRAAVLYRVDSDTEA